MMFIDVHDVLSMWTSIYQPFWGFNSWVALYILSLCSRPSDLDVPALAYLDVSR